MRHKTLKGRNHMRRCIHSLRVVLASLVAAVFGVAYGVPPAQAQDAPAAPPGRALVYVLQGDTGGYASVLVHVDGRTIDKLRANTAVAVAVEPGTHEISSAASSRGALMVSVQAGGTYYVGQRVNNQGVPELRLLSPEEGQGALRQSRLVRSDVVAVGGTASAGAAGKRSESHAQGAGDAKDGFALIVKGGSLKLSDRDQPDLGITYDDETPGVFGAEFEFRQASGLAIGGELLLYSVDWTGPFGTSGTTDIAVGLLNLKMYLNAAGSVRPYFGGGVGVAATTFSGDVTGDSSGVAYQAVAGVEFRYQKVGLLAEYKYLSADTEDEEGVEVNVGGHGPFVGLSIQF
jgi:hypothetical protein